MSESGIIVNPNTSRILMSDILKGNIEDVDEAIKQLDHITTTFCFNESAPYVGSLIAFYENDEEKCFELSSRMLIDDALHASKTFKERKSSIKISFNILMGEEQVIQHDAFTYVKAVGVDDIMLHEGLCTCTIKFGC